jgi:nucleoside-diphosphate-sugar epimerase
MTDSRELRPGVRVFLTGGTGFIGSQVARLLVRRGCDVTVLVRAGSSLRRLSDISESLKLLEGDLFAPAAFPAMLKTVAPEVVFHLAWYLEPALCLDSPKNLDCLAGSVALFQALEGTGCRRVVLAGTINEYDDRVGRATESSPLRPSTLYGACKAALACVAEQLARLQGWNLVRARMFNVYGPGEDQRRLVAHVVCKLLRGESCDITSGEQIRGYLHVEDMATALVAVAASDFAGAVNVGSSQPVSVADVARKAAALIGAEHLLRIGARPQRLGDSGVLYPDTKLLLGELGWRPRYTLEDGLRQTIDWWKDKLFLSNPEPPLAPTVAGVRDDGMASESSGPSADRPLGELP